MAITKCIKCGGAFVVGDCCINCGNDLVEGAATKLSLAQIPRLVSINRRRQIERDEASIRGENSQHLTSAEIKLLMEASSDGLI